MKTILEKVKKWLASVRSEIPAFCELCRTATRLVVKTVKKQDSAIEKSAIQELRTRTKNAQVAFGGILLIVLATCFMRGCGDSKQPSSPPLIKKENVKIQERKSLTAQEAFSKLVDPRLDELAFTNKRPKEGEIWQNEFPLLSVLQVLDGGILVETKRSMPNPEDGIFFVHTARRYADGDMLAIGFYRYVGTFSYITTGGASKTVHAFEDLPLQLQRELDRMATKRVREVIEEGIREQNAEQEAQKHPTTADAWIKYALADKRYDNINFEHIYRTLKNKSYAFEVFREHYKAELAKIPRDAPDFRQYYRTVVQVFADWVFMVKVDTPKSLLNRFMPTIKFDGKYSEKEVKLQREKDWLGLLNLQYGGSRPLNKIEDDVAYWLVYDFLMHDLASHAAKDK